MAPSFFFRIFSMAYNEKEDINMSDKIKRKACRVWEYTMLETPIFVSVAGAAVIGLWAYMIKKYDR